MNTENFASYSNFDVTGGGVAKYEGQVTIEQRAPYKVDPAKIAKARADCDTVAKLMGWK